MIVDVSIVTCSLTSSRRDRCAAVMGELAGRHSLSWRFVSDCEPASVGAEALSGANSLASEQFADPRLQFLNRLARPIGPRHISNCLNHLSALRHAARCPEGTVCIVLEDDAVPQGDWVKRLESLLSSAPKGYDVIFTGVPVPGGESPRFSRSTPAKEGVPVCDSYVVTPSAARRLSDAMLPVRLPTHAQLSLASSSASLNSFIGAPAVFVDGSKIGAFVGTVDAGPSGRPVLCHEYVHAMRLLSSESPVRESLLDAADRIRSSNHRGHPDLIHALAVLTWRLQGPSEALPLLTSALDAAENSGAVLNSESAIVRDVIDAHKHTQRTPLFLSANAVI